MTGSMKLESSLDVNNWMVGYYKNPEPETVPTVLEIVNNESRLFSNTPPERSPLSGFLSIVFKKDYRKALKWSKATESYSRIVKHTVWYSMWLADTKSFKRYLKSTIKKIKGRDSRYLQNLLDTKPLKLKILNPTKGGQLDVLWGAFFASGNHDYIKRIISVLPGLDQRTDPFRFSLAASAKWSLKSNALNDRNIFNICKSEISGNTGSIKKHLQNIIDQINGDAKQVDEMKENLRILKTEFPKEVLKKYKKK